MWEIGTLAKQTDSPFECTGIATDTEKADKLLAIFKNFGNSDDFMTIGTDLNNPKFGQRFLKYSADVVINQVKGKYWGEWS